MKDYVLIPKTTLESFKLSEEHTLTEEDIVHLISKKDVLKKFIQQKAISIQFDIGSGKRAGKETLGLELVRNLGEIAEEIGNIKNVYDDYLEEEARRKETEKEN